jgi:two-component system, chemotaxis family, sensor kinase CheA
VEESRGPMNDESDDSMERIVEKLRLTFKEEAYELLAELEATLLELEKSPANSESINRAFRVLHTIKGSAGMCAFYDVASFAHEIETYFDLVRKGEIVVTKETVDLTILASDQLTSLFDVIYCGGEADTERTEQIVASFKEQTSGKTGTRAFSGPRGADLLLPLNDEKGPIDNDKVQTALAEQQDAREQRQGADAASSIRVATGKLDSLVNLVGELVTVQARLSQTALTLGNSELQSIAEEVERLTADLRDNAMSIRMLPIGTTFSKFKRVVRDLSAELGKEIDLTTDGAETELDKTVIEKLGDPLVHIIRNSIDHGIERPDERMAAGKPRRGTIHLSALHSGAHVLIRVQDDGAGLDAETIRAKAVERGLLRIDAEITEQDLWLFILAPGFSTAKQVTGISGRGVGMDVVKRSIDAIRGVLEISSEKGAGTTITLKLPLTLAIIDGFLTKIGADSYIFPLPLVEECVELTRDNAFTRNNRHLINVRGHIVPYIRLREQFAINGEAPWVEQIVITNAGGRRVGLVVDAIVGQHQTVLKSLGAFYRDVKGISGATLLGDGTVALILDIPKLVSMAEQYVPDQAAPGSHHVLQDGQSGLTLDENGDARARYLLPS